MPVNPDTPANRALIRAVRAQDVSATAEALAHGADPNAAWGRGSSFTCSALMRAVDFQDERPGVAEIVGLLLNAGAHPWSSPYAQGRSPLEGVMRKGHAGVVEMFIRHAGGQDAFLAQAQSDRQGYRVLGALLDSGLSNPMLRELFFKALDRIPAPLWPAGASANGGVAWPWDRLPGRAVDIATVARIERRSPRPTVETLGKERWIKWLKSQSLFADKNELFRQVCRATPALWWLESLPKLGQGPDHCGFNVCLLTSLAKDHCREGLRIALATIAKDEEALAKLKRLTPALLGAAAGAGSAPIFRQFIAATGKTGLSTEEVSDLALVLSKSSYDPHHRLSLFRLFLDIGVNLEARRSPGSPTLLDQVLSWPERQSSALIDHWMAQGLDWSVQDDQGVSRLSKLARVAPERAARWRQEVLEVGLEAQSPPRKNGWRL